MELDGRRCRYQNCKGHNYDCNRGCNKGNGMVIEEVMVIKKAVQIMIIKKIRKIIDWNGVVQGNGVLMEMMRKGNGGIMR